MDLVVHGMAGFDRNTARSSLQVPDDYDVEAMIGIGRPGNVSNLPEKLRERETPSVRKPVGDIVREGKFTFVG